MAGIVAIAYGVWSVSAEREVMECFSLPNLVLMLACGQTRHVLPDRPIPSMLVRNFALLSCLQASPRN